MLHKIVYGVSVVPIKIPIASFTKVGGKNPKIHMESQKLGIAKTILSKEEKQNKTKIKAGGTITSFKTY